MKRQTLKIYANEGKLLWEAMRRIIHLDENKDINTPFSGSGTHAMYRKATQQGLFVHN